MRLSQTIRATTPLFVRRSNKKACRRLYGTQKDHEALRILFCGSDEFSIASLKAIHDEHKRDENSIASIDVVCRPGKPVGRGLKVVREVPIAGVAKELSLALHQIDTFTSWKPPKPRGLPINLVIAVSFGLLVPPRILDGATYGGLNLHPSMLPDFYGPAPLHHTLLSGVKTTGVTVQTLHPTHFDQGVILAQTPFPGFEHKSRTVQEITPLMAREGSEMLVRVIQERVFVSPLSHRGWAQEGHEAPIRHAPKITAENCHIDWKMWTAEQILRTHRVIGPLWNTFSLPHLAGKPIERRIIWSGGFSASPFIPDSELEPGMPILSNESNFSQATYIRTCDGQMLKFDSIKLDGGKEGDPLRALRRAGLAQTPRGCQQDEIAEVPLLSHSSGTLDLR